MQLSELTEKNAEGMRNAMLELALLTVLMLALVGALGIVRRRAPSAVAGA